MSEFEKHWERKIRTFFNRLDTDGDGIITKNDYVLIGENFVKAGQLSGDSSTALKDNFMQIWNKYVKPAKGGDAATCEDALTNLKFYGKSDLVSLCTNQFGLYFDAIDTNKDGLIQANDFVSIFKAFGISEDLAKEAFEGMDTDNNGVLSREKFVAIGRDFCTMEEPSYPADYLFGPLV
jgi:Ca2+-binding EF-hand superfamily protein